MRGQERERDGGDTQRDTETQPGPDGALLAGEARGRRDVREQRVAAWTGAAPSPRAGTGPPLQGIPAAIGHKGLLVCQSVCQGCAMQA
jgi:hypothetical protein